MGSDQELILAMARLARMTPEGWLQFLGALRTYTDKTRDTCIQSPLDVLPVMQGRAQLAAYLLDMAANCLTKADKIEGKSK